MTNEHTNQLFDDINTLLPVVEKARRRKTGIKVGADGDIVTCLHTSDSAEWYTPADYVEAAREVMDGIDIDPASNELANLVVKATTYYTKETNGFDKPWTGRCWLNPPFGFDGPKCNQARWSARLIEQYQAGITTEAVLLVNAVADRKWFAPLWNYPICLTDHRIHFYGPLERKTSTPVGSAFIYFGPQHKKFARVFKKFGHVICDMSASCAPTQTLWDLEATA